MKKFIHAALLAMAAANVQAAPVEAGYKDWYVGCDNTNRCEAVGYYEESDDALPVALSLAREAGPNTPVQATLFVSHDGPDTVRSVSIDVDGWRMHGLPVGAAFTNAQTGAIVPQLLNAEVAVVTSGKRTWRLSLAGAKAALLKIDEVQGRLGTPGALVRKGAKPESSVPPALAMPVLKVASDREAGRYEEMSPSLLKAMPQTGCEIDKTYVARRLTASTLLILQECERAPYQTSHRVWIANVRPPHQPRKAMLPSSDGSLWNDVMEGDFSDGVLRSWAKSRGVNDCGAAMEWVWTADGFKLLSYHEAAVCKGIPGGVPVRLWIAARR